VNIFRKNLRLPLKSAIPDNKGDKQAMIMYENDTANEYKELFEKLNGPSDISSGVYLMKYIGKMAVEITNAYAEFAQSNIAHAFIVFLSFFIKLLIRRLCCFEGPKYGLSLLQ